MIDVKRERERERQREREVEKPIEGKRGKCHIWYVIIL